MIYLIGQIICCLLIAVLLGFLIGWLLKNWFCKNNLEKLKQVWKREREDMEQRISAAQREAKEHYSKMEGFQGQLAKLKTDLDTTKSMLSECEERLNRQKTAKPAGPALTTQKTHVKDDLKKIRGIGRFIEGLLNNLGITSFKQIAEFDDNEIKRVSMRLDVFPDRIVRDEWVAQAKELHFLKYNERI